MTARIFRSRGIAASRGLLWLLALVLFGVPLGLIVSLALGENQIPTLLDQGIGRATLNSIVTTLASSVAAVVIGAVAAVLLERTDIRGRTGLRVLLLSPLLVPPFVGAIAWLQLFGRNQGVNSIFSQPVWDIYGADGIIFLMALHSYPLVYIIIGSALRSIPSDLETAARVSGAGSATTIRTVTVPLLGPALLSAFTLTSVSNLADFGVPSILGSPVGYETLATMTYRFVEQGIVPNPLQVASTVGTVVLVLGIGAVVADWVLSQRVSSSNETGATLRIPLGILRNPLSIIVWIVTLAITLGPIMALTYRALLPAPGVAFTVENITFRNFERTLTNSRVLDAISNSLLLAVGAALICGVLGWAIGLLVTRTSARSNTALTLLTLLPAALPGMIVGVGWLIFGRYTGIYNTGWVILLAYVCTFTALVLQAVRGPLKSVPQSVEEAARVSGAGRIQALIDTTGRLIFPAALAGAVLVALTAVRELTVSILLIAPGTTTLGVQLFNLQQAGDYNQASALALMFAVVGVIAAMVTLRSPKV